MKAIFIIIILAISVDFYAQTKKDPVSLIKFNVDKKTGKSEVKYSYIEATGVKYKIETKSSDSNWTTVIENSSYPFVALDNNKIVNKTDTFTVRFDKGTKQIRLLFVEPQSSKAVTQIVNIP